MDRRHVLCPSTLVDSPMQPDDDFPSMTKLDLLQVVCLSIGAAIFAFAGALGAHFMLG